MYHRFKWTRVSRRRNWISREYEPLQPYYLMALAQAGGATCFADVGANVGLYSVFMSQNVDRIIAYEANAKLQQEISRNLALNKIEATVRGVAVSDQVGKVTFGIVSNYAGNSAVVDESKAGQSFRASVVVDAVTLDEELAQIEGPIAMKIDVEGHEMSVLKGAQRTLLNKSCLLQIEDYEDRVGAFLNGLNYRRLTQIGPDSYFTNMDGLDALAVHEQAAAAMIEANHENKTMVLGGNGLGVVVSGQAYRFVRFAAQNILGRRL